MDRTSEEIDHDFTIIIPAWNESELISNTVVATTKAIEQQSYSGSIIVVDNNSTDGTAELASHAGAKVVFESINQIGRARNAGTKNAITPWLIFIDADTTVNPTLLTLALDALASDKVIGGGSTIAVDRPISKYGNMVLDFWNWVSVKSSTAAGCFIYCRRDAFEDIGGFDKKVYAGEELHLSRKMRILAKKRKMQFVIQTASPITTSARKLDWFSAVQIGRQFLFLLIPFATRSKRMCGVWYNRSKISKDS